MIARPLLLAAMAAASFAMAEPAPSPAPATALPSPAPHHPVVITNPDWVRKPGPDEFSRYFPTGAYTSGVAVIQCDVTVSGTLAGCVVVSENPKGLGFGSAALKISRYFRMKPQTRDGVPVGGGVFSTRINFQWGGVALPQWARRPTPKEMQAVWPDASVDKATVALSCLLTVRGTLKDCSVDSETPAHKGFGAAALKLVPHMAMSPATEYGHPIDTRINVSLPFVKPAPVQNGSARFYGDLNALSGAPWQTAPSEAEMAAAWPKSAPAPLPFARVRLRCSFQPDSTVGPCEVLSEDPAGYGFGQAALGLASRFRTLGAFMDERQLKIARVILPLTFTNPSLGPQAPAVITRPNWVSFIDRDSMVALYPEAAAKAGVKTGRAVVACTVAIGGKLSDCAVQSEAPEGEDFGRSALAAIAAFTVNPWTDDGRPVDGAKISVPIRFIEDEPPAEPPPTAAGSSGTAAPSPGAP